MENNIRLIDSFLKFQFVLVENDNDYELFKRDYNLLAEVDDDPVGQWLKSAKAKGETQDSDTVLLNLIVALHRKVDDLTKIIKNEECKRLELKNNTYINRIGFEYFTVETDILKKDKQYYGKIELPIFPKRDVPLFFKIIENNLIKIELMHERDIKDWDNYVATRERTIIREMRSMNGK